MNNTALITGASSGIGLELAKIFAQNKINLLLVARSKEKLKDLASDLLVKHGIQTKIIVKDLSQYEAAKEVFEYCQENNIQIQYLVNNAGFGDYGKFHEINWERQLQMIQLNITTLTYLTRLFTPLMVQNKKGKILNVSSIAGVLPGPLMAVYFATKAFVLHFSEAISNELSGTGVTVTCLCPGGTQTNFFIEANATESTFAKGKTFIAPQKVAEYGFKAMMKGKNVAIPGIMNNLMVNSVRFFPRNIVTKISRQMQQ
jgi:uncharacterized protein